MGGPAQVDMTLYPSLRQNTLVQHRPLISEWRFFYGCCVSYYSVLETLRVLVRCGVIERIQHSTSAKKLS